MSTALPAGRARNAAQVQVMKWSTLMEQFRWYQGEHVTLVGPTGQGKTTLLKSLLPLRNHVAVVATKPADESLDALRAKGYKTIRRWPPTARDGNRVLLWPKIETYRDRPRQAAEVQYALECIYQQGGWCVALDECRYVAKTLNCADVLEMLWLQGRSNGVSIVAATQRPRHLPLEAFSQATHLFLWRNRDTYDLDRLGGLGTHNTRTVRDVIADLPKYHVLYVNTRDEMLVVTKAPR